MTYDLVLYVVSKGETTNAEDLEKRGLISVGASICDKLQSLYLDRPMTIRLRDAYVARNLWTQWKERNY